MGYLEEMTNRDVENLYFTVMTESHDGARFRYVVLASHAK
jgi:hypothetical protein